MKELRAILPDQININNPDCYVKTVGMLQENWALLVPDSDGYSIRIYFCHGKYRPTDGVVGVFDSLVFKNKSDAEKELELNGFLYIQKSLITELNLDTFPPLPPAKYNPVPHANGLIYSSGRSWASIGENEALQKKVDNRDYLKQLINQDRLDINWSPLFDTEPKLKEQIPIDRLRGMLLGLAIGDSLGNTSEAMLPATRFQRHGEIRNYRKNRHAHNRNVGLPSDDTQMTFWTLESIVEQGQFKPNDIAEKFSTRQIYGRGRSVGEFVANYSRGMEWPEASSKSAGNGALMRIPAIIAAHQNGSTADLWIDTVLCAAVTHNDRASISACFALVGILLELLEMSGPPLQEWWVERYVAYARPLEGDKTYQPRGGDYLGKFSGTLSQFVLQTVPDALMRETTTVDACNRWFSGAYLLETVPSVLMILSKHAAEPEEAIIRAVNDTKDNDTIAAIVGAAMGALYGETALPQRWMDDLLGRTAQDDDGKVFDLLNDLARSTSRI